MRIRSLFVLAMAVLALAPAEANEAGPVAPAALEPAVLEPMPSFVPPPDGNAPRVDVYRNPAR